MSEEHLQFQTEVGRLLDIVVHSLYSDKDIFLRELISNASDACDKRRYLSLTQPELTTADAFTIRLSADDTAGTLTIADNGIGMNRQDLIDNLGTIARSGTSAFLKELSGDAKKDVNLIGQFGVGFYSAFMVADTVDVRTRRAGETQGWRWHSDGLGEFTITEESDVPEGTQVILHLKTSDKGYLTESELRRIIKRYSDHIALPILFGDESKPLNQASALWMRNRADITEDQYKTFYHHVAGTYDEPWMTLHWRAEGVLEYTNLLYIPSQRPFDLFHPERKNHVKLYVRRVFITEAADGLVPLYLRFVRGIVDSADLPLNVSREMLQRNPVLSKMKSGITKRILSELSKKAEEDLPAFTKFWDAFGPVVKEGLYEDFENREALLKLVRFRSTQSDTLVSFDDYLSRMKEGQTDIYFMTGPDLETALKSPQLEGFKARGIEVLLLVDPIDEFWIPIIEGYNGKPFKSITRAGADLSKLKTETPATETPKAPEGDLASLLALLRLTLGSDVKDVRPSDRLTDSAVCLVSDDGDADLHFARLMKQYKQSDATFLRILEINPSHPLIRNLAARATQDGSSTDLADAAWLLLDQARILEGEPLPNPAAFAKRLSAMVEKGLAA